MAVERNFCLPIFRAFMENLSHFDELLSHFAPPRQKLSRLENRFLHAPIEMIPCLKSLILVNLLTLCDSGQ